MQQESASENQNDSSSSSMRQFTNTNSESKKEQNQDQEQLKIIKEIHDVKLKLKKGKNTPTIHVHSLRDYMKQFRHHYIFYRMNLNNQLVMVKDKDYYYNRAVKKVWDTVGCPQNPKKQAINTSHLWHLFGGIRPKDKNSQEMEQFIINRMNAKVLELIYQKYMLKIVFGSPKIEDKLTTLFFIQQFRSRLINPLLCGKLECPRPRQPEVKKNKKHSLTDSDMPEKKQTKQKPIRK